MSKRFGRNQRRRARERIAYLERSHAHMREGAALRERQIEDMREHLHYVAATLGHMNVLAAGELHEVEGRDRMQLAPSRPYRSTFDPAAIMDPTEFACAEIMRLLDVKAVHDMASRAVHTIVHLADKKVAYGISETALRTMPREALRKLLERQVAPLLAASIAELVGKL